ncbi:MAG: rod shape-determining protein MreD, partial [Bacteroidota bacterium]|nr:rod shape-determining protein MreD [Bacteroidota bacterium]
FSPLFIMIQILILNEIFFANLANPFLYIILIITLPKNTPKWFLLIFAFQLGFFVDLFSNSLGYHSTACVLIAFLRPIIIDLIIANNLITESDQIEMQKLGFKSFILYAFILIFIHHSTLFLIEYYDFKMLISILLKIIISSSISLLLISITQLLFYKNK